jgi:hypothetical protein
MCALSGRQGVPDSGVISDLAPGACGRNVEAPQHPERYSRTRDTRPHPVNRGNDCGLSRCMEVTWDTNSQRCPRVACELLKWRGGRFRPQQPGDAL